MPWLFAALAALIGFVGFRRVRVDRSKRAYPPGPDAVDTDRAKALGAALAAKPRLDRSDLAIQFAPSASETVEPLLHGRHFFPRMLADIEAATSSVHLMIYGFKPGDIGTIFKDALIAKAAAGVQVRLVVDSIGSEIAFGSKALYKELTDGGVGVVANEGAGPDFEGSLGSKRKLDWRFDDLGHFDHRKFMIVDGRIGYVGGAGIEDHFNDERFYDVFVRYTGPAVHQLQTLFIAAWRYHQGPLPTDPTSIAAWYPEIAAPAGGGIRTTLLTNTPGEDHYPITDAIEHMLENAQAKIDIVNPYITDHGILERMLAAAGRGVKVRMIIPGKPTPPYAAAAFKSWYGRMLDAGIVLVAHPDMAHAKVIRVDDRVLAGGCNLDALSLYHNHEVDALFEDAGTAAWFEEHLFDAWQAVSTPVQVATKPTERAFNAVMDVLSPLM
jgi:cardiolipin synthase A/B